MNIGDLIFQTALTNGVPGLRMSYKAPAGRTFVSVLVGLADRKDPFTFDAAKALHDLGWVEETRLHEAQDKIKQLEARLRDLTTAVRENHEWHTQYDDHGGYPGSNLQATNLAALTEKQVGDDHA